eukprot:5676716-Pyramimonas_sp.AAC.1
MVFVCRGFSFGLLLHRSASSESHVNDAAADHHPHDVRDRAAAGLHCLRRDGLRGLKPQGLCSDCVFGTSATLGYDQGPDGATDASPGLE